MSLHVTTKAEAREVLSIAGDVMVGLACTVVGWIAGTVEQFVDFGGDDE